VLLNRNESKSFFRLFFSFCRWQVSGLPSFFALKCTENREKIAGIISVIFKTRLTNTFKYFHQPTAGSFTAIFFVQKCTENREKIAGIISVIFKTRLTNTFKYFHQPSAGCFTAIFLGCKNQMDFVFDTLVPFPKNGLFALKSPGVHW